MYSTKQNSAAAKKTEQKLSYFQLSVLPATLLDICLASYPTDQEHHPGLQSQSGVVELDVYQCIAKERDLHSCQI
jgi:hypothetical protein